MTLKPQNENKMFLTALYLMLLAGFSTNLSGCVYLSKDCNDLIGTAEYDYCLANQGNEIVQYELGLAAYKEADMETALKWLKKAANPDASMDHIYSPPVGSQKYGTVLSFPKANPYQGYREAQLLLARIYGGGIGVDVDTKKAEAYRKLAEVPRGSY